MKQARAFAKINLALVVGPLRDDGKHELVTVLQRIDLADDITLEPADALIVEGFAADTLVRGALEALAEAARVHPGWRARIEKRIPVAAGLGGGSTDAATALTLANSTLPRPLAPDALHAIAAGIGADVPFFLHEGTQLARGDGTELERVDLPLDYIAVVVLPDGVSKESTGTMYRAFDDRDGPAGFEQRRSALLDALASVEHARDLACLPKNDLGSSSLVGELEAVGTFHADLAGAGPSVYGLFERLDDAERAAETLAKKGKTWIVRPL